MPSGSNEHCKITTEALSTPAHRFRGVHYCSPIIFGLAIFIMVTVKALLVQHPEQPRNILRLLSKQYIV
jgi:hypothetical protein